MKSLSAVLIAAGVLSASPAFAADWLQGVYVNQDADGLMKEVVFCDGGKAYAGMGHRQYTVDKEDGKTVVTLQSNGTFHFTESKDGALLPADDFTKEWFTKTSLVKDPSRKDTCNW